MRLIPSARSWFLGSCVAAQRERQRGLYLVDHISFDGGDAVVREPKSAASASFATRAFLVAARVCTTQRNLRAEPGQGAALGDLAELRDRLHKGQELRRARADEVVSELLALPELGQVVGVPAVVAKLVRRLVAGATYHLVLGPAVRERQRDERRPQVVRPQRDAMLGALVHRGTTGAGPLQPVCRRRGEMQRGFGGDGFLFERNDNALAISPATLCSCVVGHHDHP